MGYNDKAKQIEYQREWMRKRREQWFAENGPCAKCGGSERLEIDHRDRADKVDHKVWSWTEEKRNAELKKCQVLCHECHRVKSRSEQRDLTDQQVFEIWDHRATGANVKAIATALKLSPHVVRKIVYKERYKEVTEQYFFVQGMRPDRDS